MVKAVLFDLDGVLTLEKTGSQSILRFFAQQTGISYDQLKQAYYPYNRDLLLGRMTHREMWLDFCAAVGIELDYSLLADSFHNTPMDDEMIRLARELKKRFRMGMVTDNKCDRVAAILDQFQLRDLFDVVSISAEVGSGKDQPATFQQALTALGIQPEEAIFIDNSPGNLIVPEQMGIHTILFDDEKRDMNALRATIQQLI